MPITGGTTREAGSPAPIAKLPKAVLRPILESIFNANLLLGPTEKKSSALLAANSPKFMILLPNFPLLYSIRAASNLNSASNVLSTAILAAASLPAGVFKSNVPALTRSLRSPATLELTAPKNAARSASGL